MCFILAVSVFPEELLIVKDGKNLDFMNIIELRIRPEREKKKISYKALEKSLDPPRLFTALLQEKSHLHLRRDIEGMNFPT